MEMGLAAAIDFAGGRVGHGEILPPGFAAGGLLNTTFREPVVDPRRPARRRPAPDAVQRRADRALQDMARVAARAIRRSSRSSSTRRHLAERRFWYSLS